MKIDKTCFYNLNIDCHTHFGYSLSMFFGDKVPFCQNMVGLLEKIENGVINGCITFPFPDDFIGNEVLEDADSNHAIRQAFEQIPYKMQNDRLLLEASTFGKNRVFPFLLFSNRYAIDEQIEYLNNVIKSHYVYGLKYYPEADNLSFSDFEKRGAQFISFMEENNLPLIVHSSAGTVVSDDGLSHPRYMLQLASNHPQLRVCIAHMAHFSVEVFEQILHLPNLYVDTSPLLHLCHIRRLVKSNKCLDLDYCNPSSVLNYLVCNYSSHILWASDFPVTYTCNLLNEDHDKDYSSYSYEKNIKVLSSLDEDSLNKITRTNVINYLYGEQ